MKINTGNFGQQVANLTPESVQHQEVTSVAQAQQTGAQQVGAAGMNLGKTIAQIGNDLHEHYTRMAKLSAQQRVADYAQFQQDTLDSIDAQVQQGQLDSKGAAATFAKAMQEKKAEFDKSPIMDLDSEGKAFLDKGIGQAAAAGAHRMGNYVEKLAWGEADRQLDATAAQFGTATQRGEDLQTTLAAVDKFYDDNAAHYGPQIVEQKKAAMRKQVLMGHFRFNIEQNAGSNSNLQKIKAQAMGAGLDDASLASINSSIDTKINTNDAKAIAAQNHRDAVMQRRETAANTAVLQMQSRINKGEIPTEEDWQTYDSKVHGTIAANGNSTQQMQEGMKATQEAYRMKPDALDAEVNRLTIQLDNNGGTAADYAKRDAYQRVASQREKDLTEDTQNFISRQNGTPLQPIAFDANNTTEFTELEHRFDNMKQARDQFGYRAGDDLLTPAEQKNFQAKWETMTPAQRVEYSTSLRNNVGPEIADTLFSSLKKVDPNITAVASVAHTPAGQKFATDLQVGSDMVKKGAVNAPKDADIMASIDEKYGDTITPQQKLQMFNTIKPVLIARGQTKDNWDSKEADKAMSEGIGERVQITTQGFHHSYAIAPPGADATQFSNDMSRQLDMLQGQAGQSVRNGLDSGLYSIVQAPDGSYRISDGRRYVATGGQTIVLKVNK